MNEGIHLDLDTWIVPGQIRQAQYDTIILPYINHVLVLHSGP